MLGAKCTSSRTFSVLPPSCFQTRPLVSSMLVAGREDRRTVSDFMPPTVRLASMAPMIGRKTQTGSNCRYACRTHPTIRRSVLSEFLMQGGRWYPSALVMSNGSVLIMGGETGANAAPNPTLEILPRIPGGSTTVCLDWLSRTDPNNLYPFLHVLPSGRIFAGAFETTDCLAFLLLTRKGLQGTTMRH